MTASKKSFFRRRPLRVREDTITNAANLTLRESLFPLFLVTILYFLWGFAYGLLDTLNKHFQNTLHITRNRSSALQVAYFGAYPFASLGFASYILRKVGYKATFMTGLGLYGIGALLMWPAGIYRSFGGFCGATFVIGSGLGSLETAANPFMAVCGPPKYAEMRINLAQSFQAVGTIVGPLLGSYAFFKNIHGDNVDSLKSVQWVYLAIAIFVFLLAGVFYISTIPEITDADMELQATQTHGGNERGSFWKEYTLFHAAFAQFCYCAGQVAIAGYFINYVTETRAHTSSALGAKYLAGAQGCFTLGRFGGTFLMKYVKPRWVLLGFLSCVIAFNAASIHARGDASVAMLMITLAFESICFPTIVALGIRGLGKHTKQGSGWIIAGVFGGVVGPSLLSYVADLHNSTAYAMIVSVMFFVGAFSYALCVNFVPHYRALADATVLDLDAAAVGAAVPVSASEKRDLETGHTAVHAEDSSREDVAIGSHNKI